MLNEPRRSIGQTPGLAARAKGVFARILAVTLGLAMFVGAFLVSIVFFAVALAIAVVIGGVFWWKTRHLRKQMRQRYAGGDVIDGTVISSEEPRPPPER